MRMQPRPPCGLPPRSCSRTAPAAPRTWRRRPRCPQTRDRRRASREPRRARRAGHAPSPRWPPAPQRASGPRVRHVEYAPSMRITAPTETAPGETRVALVPRSATQLVSTGATVAIQAGAGAAAGITDAAYVEVGAEVAADQAALLADADIVVVVRRPDVDLVSKRNRG